MKTSSPPSTKKMPSRRKTPRHTTAMGGPEANPPVSKRVTVHDFEKDPLFPRVQRAVAECLANGKVVAPVDVLVRIDIVTPKALEDWRFGRVPYLERVIRGSLPRLNRLLRIVAFHCHDLNLVATPTAYVKWGKGPRTPLRFTKSRDQRLEGIYARHFVWPGKGPFHPPRAKSGSGGSAESSTAGAPATRRASHSPTSTTAALARAASTSTP
jgi:hypothetical protein